MMGELHNEAVRNWSGQQFSSSRPSTVKDTEFFKQDMSEVISKKISGRLVWLYFGSKCHLILLPSTAS